MSRKWRNILIGVVAVAAVIVAVVLLSKGDESYHQKYEDTYDAYLSAHAADAYATVPVTVDVGKFTYNQTVEKQQLQREADEKAKKEEEQKKAAAAKKNTSDSGENVAENPEAPDGAGNGEDQPAPADQGTENTEPVTEEQKEPETDSEPAGTVEPAPAVTNPEAAARDNSDGKKANKMDMKWTVPVQTPGMYSILIGYELEREVSSDAAAETTADEEDAQALPDDEIYVMRELLINGAVPFSEAGELKFSSLKPNEIQETYLLDDLGYHATPYVFYFPAGENTLTLRATDKSRMTVHSITLTKPATDILISTLKGSSDDKLIGYDSYVSTYSMYEPIQAEDEKAIDLSGHLIGSEGKVEPLADGSLYCGDDATVTWQVPVTKAGLYNIRLEYLTTDDDDSHGTDIERELLINGRYPFSGAETLNFTRMWKDDETDLEDGEFRTDNQGNQIRPRQIEYIGESQEVYLRDSMGYQTEPYAFFLEEGYTLTLRSVNEPMVICGIRLTPIAQYRSYADYSLDNKGKAQMTDEGKNYSYTVQGEKATLRSAPSLYAKYDRSSSKTVPYSVNRTILNYIGGDPWTHPGEWIQWDFYVPEDGYYNISVKARQMYQRGALSARTVYIDDEIPFKEMEYVTFGYNTSWEMRTLGDENGTPYRFYLEKGRHTIRMEVTMGKMGQILQDVEDSIYRLNQIYRKLLVLTGATPDRFRDYNLALVYPDVIRRMEREYKRLYKIVDDVVDITGEKNDRAAVALTLAVQMEQFVNNTDRITESFTNFKDNITSLGTAMQNMSESKLDVDLIMITGENAAVPKSGESFLQGIIHEIRSCVSSYTVDYNTLGDKYEDTDEVLEVWITTGRDQSTVLKKIVDDMFTNGEKGSGIKVNVKLVQADAILPAVVAGNGPDVVISVSGWFAVNYAMRNAVEDLTQFADFEEVSGRFHDSILQPLRYDNGEKVGVYGLPETQNFPMLFYRSDIMMDLGKELGMEDGLPIPETWEQLIEELPTIQGNNLTVGIPFPDITIADISVFNSLVYQNGGSIYDKDAKHTLIDSEAGIAAFKLYTSLYNDYGLPVVYDFVSRFRSGEMPLGITSYSTFNTLTVSAPEIRGLWDFTHIPGTKVKDENGNDVLDENGNPVIDYTSHTDGLCCMIIATDNETVKKNAWEFIKWWTDKEAQTQFGREMESVLGSSARYQTANTEAFEDLSWSKRQKEKLKDQMDHTRGFPEIAGGYSTTRHITNAIRRVINTKEDARETLLNYARTINEEIRIKRQEFNLPVD